MSTAASSAATAPGGAGESVAEAHGGVGSLRAVSAVLAQRNLIATLRIPATVIPTIVMPVFFVLAFGGAFSALTELPVFPTDNILDWMAPFAVLQGASFAGLAAAFSAGRDLENGFYDRLLLAPSRRLALATGPLLYSAGRSVLPLLTVVPVAYLGGARLDGGVAGFAVLALAATGTALVAGIWGLGVVWRLRTQRATALVQVGIFVVLFLSVGQVPLEAMDGTWLATVARWNPFTDVLTMARSGFLGPVELEAVARGVAALVVSGALMGVFAWRGFAKFDR